MESDSEDDERYNDLTLARRDWKRMESERFKSGYRDGLSIDEGEAGEVLQEAFDAGYEIGFSLAFRLSTLHARLAFVLGLHDSGRKPMAEAKLEKTKRELEQIKAIYTKVMQGQKEAEPLKEYLKDETESLGDLAQRVMTEMESSIG